MSYEFILLCYVIIEKEKKRIKLVIIKIKERYYIILVGFGRWYKFVYIVCIVNIKV